jgi:hypothetical protein
VQGAKLTSFSIASHLRRASPPEPHANGQLTSYRLHDEISSSSVRHPVSLFPYSHERCLSKLFIATIHDSHQKRTSFGTSFALHSAGGEKQKPSGGRTMANSQLLQTAKAGKPKLLVVEKRIPVVETLDLLNGLDRLLLKIACPFHEWSWPRSNKNQKIKGFGCHQTCSKCASQRLFNSRSWTPGPYFRTRITGENHSKNHSASGHKEIPAICIPSGRPILCIQK